MKKVSISKLPVTSAELFGRENELELLNQAWQDKNTGIVTVKAWGGWVRPRW